MELVMFLYFSSTYFKIYTQPKFNNNYDNKVGIIWSSHIFVLSIVLLLVITKTVKCQMHIS